MKRTFIIATLALAALSFAVFQTACQQSANQPANVAQANSNAPQTTASPSTTPERNFDELAHRIVTTSANIQPGEVVVITGGKHTIPLMEAIAIEAQKAGGIVNILLNSDKVARSFNVDVPDKYLEQEPRYLAEWLKQTDVFITLPGASDIKALNEGVSAERLGKINKAGDFLTPMLDSMKYRQINIVYPTEERGKSFRLDGQTYVNMIWDAIGADYKQVADKGNALKQKLQGAKKIHVTSPNGTDLTFEVGTRPVFVDDGIVSAEEAKSKKFTDRTAGLPGGTLTFAPVENSANGKVVVAKVDCLFQPMSGITFELKNGRMENLQIAQGKKCLDDLMATSDEMKDMFSSFTIGLNPKWPMHEENGAAYYAGGNTAGMVFIGLGDNQTLGGSIKTKGNFGFGFPILNATVFVDDQKVVENGKLL
ncbi:MAG: aminopeptidase [Pyrinomonadaceae bacterium]